MGGLWTNDLLERATSLIGTAVLLYAAYSCVSFGFSLLRPSQLHRYARSGNGAWALVTGASDGIGLAFVHELLNRDFNVLLHGRNKSKLEKLRDELTKKYPKLSLEIAVADASQYDGGYMAVVEKAKNLSGKLTYVLLTPNLEISIDI
jgi:17beta-estradiol 17-dehydrogenase / very-long-chain 3-oxoacyl-CoA reductase